MVIGVDEQRRAVGVARGASAIEAADDLGRFEQHRRDHHRECAIVNRSRDAFAKILGRRRRDSQHLDALLG